MNVTPSKIVRIKVSTLEALDKLKSRPEETMDGVIWRLILELKKMTKEAVKKASGGLID